VVRVDQLAAELAHLLVRPVAVAVGMHPAADAVGSFVDARRSPLVLQRERGVEPGDAAADDRDAGRRGSRTRRTREQSRADGDRSPGGGAPLQEVTASVGGLGASLAQLGRTDAQPLGVVVLLARRSIARSSGVRAISDPSPGCVDGS
jgi:hypothetical protein